jgi:hypothetical protein
LEDTQHNDSYCEFKEYVKTVQPKYMLKSKLSIRFVGNLPDNVATINYQIQSEENEYRIFTLYFIHT